MEEKDKKEKKKRGKARTSRNITTLKLQNEIRYMMSMYCRIFELDASSSFHNLLISYLENPESLNPNEHFFVNSVVSYLKSQGVSKQTMVEYKDLFMSRELKKNEGSFFTPRRWARKAQGLVIDQIGGVSSLKDYHVWDSSCGSGNLLYDMPECKHLWLSTLNSEDIDIVNTRFKTSNNRDNFTAFQLDFLSDVDSNFYKGFSNLLPEGLYNALANNEKLAIIINPPYSVSGVNTPVGDVLLEQGLFTVRVDLYRQFIWQVINLVKVWNLTNVEFICMVSGGIHTSKRAELTLKIINEVLNYRGGFLFPANEFEGVSDEFTWAISTTHWGISDGEELVPVKRMELDVFHSGIDKVPYKDWNGELAGKDLPIIFDEKTEFSLSVQHPPIKWAKELEPEGATRVYPKIDSYGQKVIDGTLLTNKADALFFIYARTTLRDNPMYITAQTTPMRENDLAVTAETLDRAIFLELFAYRKKMWNERSYQRWIAPVENDFYKTEWLANGYLIFQMHRRNLTYAVRDLPTQDGILNLNNGTFPFRLEEVRAMNLPDNVRADLELHGKENTAWLDKLDWAIQHARPELVSAFKTVKGIYEKYLITRQPSDNALNSAYDLSMAQIRRLPNYTKEDEQVLIEALKVASSILKEINMGLTFDYGGRLEN